MTAPFLFRPRVARVPGAPPLHLALAALARGPDPCVERPVLLDSAAGSPRRFSLLGFDPVAAVPGDARLSALADLGPLLARLAPAPGGDALPEDCPFAGGFLGALAYDLGVAGEGLVLPAEPWGFPLVAGGLYTDFLFRDERRGATWLVLGDEPGDDRPPAEARRAALLLRLAAPLREPSDQDVRALGPLERCVTSAEHRSRIRRAQEEIAGGEIYQANVAHRLTRALEGDPVDLYLRLRAANPAPYMGYAAFDGGALLSSSPELLLQLEPEDGVRVARTRPIKGTAPRGATPEVDAARAAALCASQKDRAELTMIVDLERNDLGRVAEVGSVSVGTFPRLESYAAVHHLAADVSCRPRADAGALDVLASLFPGGSVTGAPKLRAMEVIAELEGEGRGFFTGSLGLLDLRGRALFNILIRTLLWRATDPGRGEASFRVGGGITWASDPDQEDAETLDKARAMAAALEGARPFEGSKSGASGGPRALRSPGPGD